MPHYLSDDELKRVAPAETAAFNSPVPTQIVSNGEYNPPPQTREQRQVEARIKEMADELGRKHGMNRREFLASSAGMAAAFLAMNEVFGPTFDVSRAEAAEPGVADVRAAAMSGQFIIDAQTHFVRDDFSHTEIMGLSQYAKAHWNPKLVGENSLSRVKFQNYLKEIYLDSDTKVAVLSGAPFDDPTWELLPNDQIVAARALINEFSGGKRRVIAHAVFTPKRANSHGVQVCAARRVSSKSARFSFFFASSINPPPTRIIGMKRGPSWSGGSGCTAIRVGRRALPDASTFSP
jgi:hypothetical protein